MKNGMEWNGSQHLEWNEWKESWNGWNGHLSLPF